jgi:two-component system response regulator AlgR
VVFVSAHAEHALAAFDLDAVDYLTKPVRRDRLLAALQRVRQRLQPVSVVSVMTAPAPALVITDRGRVLRLPVPELLYFKAELKYVTLRTAEHSYVLDESLTELEQRLAALQPLGATAFIRVHRNALVGLHAIRALELRELREGAASATGDTVLGGEFTEGPEGWAVRVAPVDEWLAVSRRQVGAVRAALAPGTSAAGDGAKTD